VPDFHRLAQFTGYADGAALLSRYNVAQQQAALYDAVSVTVRAGRDFKAILRCVKLAGLMHTILREPAGRYRLRCDGPASALRRTPRYGAAMSRFLPALIACRDWSLSADIARRGGRRLRLLLSSADGLTSSLPAPGAFDSGVEGSFAARWGPEPRCGWTLIREGAVLSRGQKTFIPDFVFRHEGGSCALLEIVGFWTPQYLQAKRETLHAFSDTPILLAVAHSNCLALAPLPHDAIVYKSALRVSDVLDRLQRSAISVRLESR
jgi:predicted nuclease of restriction endonuclease-like RecB superfamily